MRIMEKSKSKRIKEAAIKDGINYIIGLSKIPVPLETIKKFITIRERNPHHILFIGNLKSGHRYIIKNWKNA